MKSFGTIRLSTKGDKWVIDCEPHVVMRLKRVFAKIGKYSHGQIRVSATEENSADLAWFLQRYPMEVLPADVLESRAAAYRERMSLVDSLLSRRVAPPAFDLAVPLREYQRIAAAVTLQTGSLLLADDVGLGKTAAAIGTFSDPRTLPALVVTLTHLPKQWEAEIHRFAPKLRTHILKTATPYDIATLTGPKGAQLGLPTTVPDIIITSYSKLSGWSDALAPLVKSVVWDECVTEDTRVSMWPVEDGRSTRIVDLSAGDRIASFDINGNVVDDTVQSVTAKGTREVWRLTLEDGRHLDCTSNERIMTEAGWRYAAEIVNEACDSDAFQPTEAASGHGSSAAARVDAWGRESGLSTYPPSHWDGARASSGGVLPTQGDDSDGLRANDAEARSESRLREGVLCIPHRDNPSLRVLALPMHSDGRRAHEEDRHPGVVGTPDLGGCGILVHGRRQCNEESSRYQHALVHGGGSPDAGSMARGEGLARGGGHGAEAGEARVLDTSVSGRSGDDAGGECSPVCPSLHGLQDRVCGTKDDGMPILRAEGDGRPQAYRRKRDLLCEGGLSARSGSKVEAAPSASTVARRLVSVESVGRHPVYDVETKRHHTLFANGFAVHNCQELRREGDPKKPSQKYSAAKHIAGSTAFRMGLSATPFYNYGGEMRAVMECIRPGALGEKGEFELEWCTHSYGEKPRIKDPGAFGTYLRESALMLRRTRAEVGREIPPVTKVPHHIESDAEAIEKAEDASAELARIILTQGGKGFDKMQAGQELDNRIRQATGIAKAPYVAEFVRLLVEAGEKVLVYAWHREVYSILLERLSALKPALYTGSESASQKEESKQRFLKDDTRVLIMSLRSGAGVDGLQAVCRTVVFAELDWSPGVHEQNIGRIARDGQTDPVVAYFLLADSGSDPIVSDVLGLKRQQIEGVRNPDAELVEKLDVDEGRIKRLAEGLLRQRGLPVPKAEEGAAA